MLPRCTEPETSKNEMGGACSVESEESGVYRVLVCKPEGKSSLGRPRSSWDDIRMDVGVVGCGVWTGLGWLRIETSGGQLRMR
jgi:hypothetical protein